MKFKHLGPAALIAATLAVPLIAQAECSSIKAQAADQATDGLSSWDAVYAFYRKYGDCIDGGAAEAVGDRVQTLWDEHWSSLPQMLRFVNRDPGFRRLMIRVAKSEAFNQDRFARVLRSASSSCPKGGQSFCAVIRRASRKENST